MTGICACGAATDPNDRFCQACGRPVVASAEPVATPRAAGAGLFQAALGDSVALVRMQPARAARAIVAVGLPGAVVVAVASVAVLVIGASILSSATLAAQTAEPSTAVVVSLLGGLTLAWLLVPAVVGLAAQTLSYAVAAARYPPLVGTLPAYRHRGLDGVTGRWPSALAPGALAFLAVQAAYLVCTLPGLYVYGRVAMAPFEATAGNGARAGAVSRSWDRTRPHVWQIVGVGLVANLVSFGPLLVAAGVFVVLASAMPSVGTQAVLALVLGLPALTLGLGVPPLPLAVAWVRITEPQQHRDAPATSAAEPALAAASEAPPASSAPPAVVHADGTRRPSPRLVLDDGAVVPLDVPVIIGRSPARTASDVPTARLVAVNDPGRSISKTHALIDVADGRVWVSDRHSTNGTTVGRPDGGVVQVPPGGTVEVPEGGWVVLGDRRVDLRVPLGGEVSP